MLIGIAVSGVLGALNLSNRSSVDPMIEKQALAVAEAIMEEIQLMPFTYCDPDDTAAATANSAADCTGGVNGANDESTLPLGAETGESRTSTTTPYDNVSDYNSLVTPVTGITDITGAAIANLGSYILQSVTVAQQALGTIPAASSLLITVTVQGPAGSGITVTLVGYRIRYAPNALP